MSDRFSDHDITCPINPNCGLDYVITATLAEGLVQISMGPNRNIRGETMDHEGFQGVLAVRFGETRQYFAEEPEEGDYYAVALIKIPKPPTPCSEKTEGLTVICAGRSGPEGKWGYLAMEKDTKQLIGEDLADTVKVEPGRWYWLQLA